jgi:heat shock protein HslJ
VQALLGTWTIESVAGTPTPDGVASDLTFDDEGHVFGRAGVNRMRGSWSAQPTGDGTADDAGVLLLTPMATTMMFGPDDAMAHERAVLAVLAGPLPFRVDGDVLQLGPDPDGIVARRQAPTA